MPASNRIRGNRFERECVALAEQHRLDGERAWGSDGRALGFKSNVDLNIAGYKGQCKIRKAKWPKWFYQQIVPDDNVDFQAVRCDREEPYAILRLDDFFRILKMATLYGKQKVDCE